MDHLFKQCLYPDVVVAVCEARSVFVDEGGFAEEVSILILFYFLAWFRKAVNLGRPLKSHDGHLIGIIVIVVTLAVIITRFLRIVLIIMIVTNIDILLA